MPYAVTFAKLDVFNQVVTALGENTLQNVGAIAGPLVVRYVGERK